MLSSKILIIEDDVPIRMMYEFKLSAAGYEILTATTGYEGLDIAFQHKPRLILLDLKLPGIMGYEVLKEIRNQSWGYDVKVIVLTNLSKTEAPQSLQIMKVDKYIVKAHYTPKLVLDVVKELLNEPVR